MPFGAVPCTFTDIKDQSVGYRIFTLPLPDRIYSQWAESHKYYPYVYVSDFFPIPCSSDPIRVYVMYTRIARSSNDVKRRSRLCTPVTKFCLLHPSI